MHAQQNTNSTQADSSDGESHSSTDSAGKVGSSNVEKGILLRWNNSFLRSAQKTPPKAKTLTSTSTQTETTYYEDVVALEDTEKLLLDCTREGIHGLSALVHSEGRFKNKTVEVKLRLRQLQRLCERFIYVRKLVSKKRNAHRGIRY
ncbi:jg26662 [Pararge aegeria aegeria]|uniref:Jg26662 protein n=1 Tax=Pararge aegeria aegeria TaxID=348720 RepID=A0A8S4QWT7_9NEOP|nr:jg26662 [Pararge aegeria aegeria]